jgi:glycosyltransferase 2 family protein
MKIARAQISRASQAAGREARGDFLGYIFAVVCLVWVLRAVDFSALAEHVADIRLGLIGAAILFDVLSYIVQGWRWTLLLRPVGLLSVFEATQAIYTGLFVNEVLPLKLGEAVRGFLAARRLETGFTSVLPAMLVERFFDAVWLAAGFAVTACFVDLPPRLIKTGEFFGAAVILVIGVFALLAGFGAKGENESTDVAADTRGEQKKARLERLKAAFFKFSKSLRAVGTRPASIAAFLLSLALIFLQAASFWLAMRAYGINVSPLIGLPVFLIVHVGSALPGAPSNVGSYQFFTVLALTLFGIDKAVAAEFSIVVFLALTAPLWILGFLALSSSGLTLSALREEIRRLRSDKNA